MLIVSEKKMNREEIKNKRVLHSFTMWEESPTSLGGDSMNYHELMDELSDRYIHIQCGTNEYIDLEKISGKWIQISGSSDDNYSEGKFNLISQKADELYIDLATGLIDMNDVDTIRKDFIIKTVNQTQNRVVYYGLAVNLEIKQHRDDKGIKTNTLDIKVYLHELKSISLLLNTITLGFYSMLIYFLINIIRKQFNFAFFDYAFIVVIIAYIGQVALRTKYVKNTLLNRLYWWCKRKLKKTKYDPFRFNVKTFSHRIANQHAKYEKNEKR